MARMLTYDTFAVASVLVFYLSVFLGVNAFYVFSVYYRSAENCLFTSKKRKIKESRLTDFVCVCLVESSRKSYLTSNRIFYKPSHDRPAAVNLCKFAVCHLLEARQRMRCFKLNRATDDYPQLYYLLPWFPWFIVIRTKRRPMETVRSWRTESLLITSARSVSLVVSRRYRVMGYCTVCTRGFTGLGYKIVARIDSYFTPLSAVIYGRWDGV